MLAVATILLFACLWLGGRADPILLLGGNGMIGSATAHQLLESGHNLTLVHRGTNYWDYATRIAPRVKHIKCDRSKGLSTCNELVNWLKDKQFQAVLDFTGTDEKHMKDPLSLLTPHTSLYVYISAAAVYEVAAPKTHQGPTREEDANRAKDQEENKQLSEANKYGNTKLLCEEAVVSAHAESKAFDYVILRLPDVIGPRDNSNRWWVFQFWVRMRKHMGLPVAIRNKHKGVEQSFAYVTDVARAVQAAVEAGPGARNQAYNLGLDQGRSTEALVQDIAAALGEKEADYPLLAYTDKETAPDFYPTATRGPLDTARAGRNLGLKATPWEEVVHETTSFYEGVMKTGNPLQQRRDEFLFFMVSHVTGEKQPAFFDGLEQAYGLDNIISEEEKKKLRLKSEEITKSMQEEKKEKTPEPQESTDKQEL